MYLKQSITGHEVQICIFEMRLGFQKRTLFFHLTAAPPNVRILRLFMYQIRLRLQICRKGVTNIATHTYATEGLQSTGVKNRMFAYVCIKPQEYKLDLSYKDKRNLISFASFFSKFMSSNAFDFLYGL